VWHMERSKLSLDCQGEEVDAHSVLDNLHCIAQNCEKCMTVFLLYRSSYSFMFVSSLEKSGHLEEAAESYREAMADEGGEGSGTTNVGVAREKLGRVRKILEREVGITELM